MDKFIVKMNHQYEFVIGTDHEETKTELFFREMGNVIQARDNVIRLVITKIQNWINPPQNTFQINEAFFQEEFV